MARQDSTARFEVDPEYEQLEVFGTIAELLQDGAEGDAARDAAGWFNETRSLLDLAKNQLGEVDDFLAMSPEGRGAAASPSTSPHRFRSKAVSVLQAIKLKRSPAASNTQSPKKFGAGSAATGVDGIALSEKDIARYLGYIDRHYRESRQMTSLLPPMAVFLADSPAATREALKADLVDVMFKILLFYTMGEGVSAATSAVLDGLLQATALALSVSVAVVGAKAAFSTELSTALHGTAAAVSNKKHPVDVLCRLIGKTVHAMPLLLAGARAFPERLSDPESGNFVSLATTSRKSEFLQTLTSRQLLKVLIVSSVRDPQALNLLPAADFIVTLNQVLNQLRLQLPSPFSQDDELDVEKGSKVLSPTMRSPTRSGRPEPGPEIFTVSIDDVMSFLEVLCEQGSEAVQGLVQEVARLGKGSTATGAGSLTTEFEDMVSNLAAGAATKAADVAVPCTQLLLKLCHAADPFVIELLRRQLFVQGRLVSLILGHEATRAQGTEALLFLCTSADEGSPTSGGSHRKNERFAQFAYAVKPILRTLLAKSESASAQSPTEQGVLLKCIVELSCQSETAERADLAAVLAFLRRMAVALRKHLSQRTLDGTKVSAAPTNDVVVTALEGCSKVICAIGPSALLLPHPDKDTCPDMVLSSLLAAMDLDVEATLKSIRDWLGDSPSQLDGDWWTSTAIVGNGAAKETADQSRLIAGRVLLDANAHLERILTVLLRPNLDELHRRELGKVIVHVHLLAKGFRMTHANIKVVLQLMENALNNHDTTEFAVGSTLLRPHVILIDELTKPHLWKLVNAACRELHPFHQEAEPSGEGRGPQQLEATMPLPSTPNSPSLPSRSLMLPPDVVESSRRILGICFAICADRGCSLHMMTRGLHVTFLKHPLTVAPELEALQLGCLAQLVSADESRLLDLLSVIDSTEAGVSSIATNAVKYLHQRCSSLLNAHTTRQLRLSEKRSLPDPGDQTQSRPSPALMEQGDSTNSFRLRQLMDLSVRDQIQWLDSKLSKLLSDESAKVAQLSQRAKIADLEKELATVKIQLKESEAQVAVLRHDSMERKTKTEEAKKGDAEWKSLVVQLRTDVEASQSELHSTKAQFREIQSELERCKTELAYSKQRLDIQQHRSNVQLTATHSGSESSEKLRENEELKNKDLKINQLEYSLQLLDRQYQDFARQRGTSAHHGGSSAREAEESMKESWRNALPYFPIVLHAVQKVAAEKVEFTAEQHCLREEANKASEAVQQLLTRTRSILEEVQTSRDLQTEKHAMEQELQSLKKRFDYLNCQLLDENDVLSRNSGSEDKEIEKLKRRLELTTKLLREQQREVKRLSSSVSESEALCTSWRRQHSVLEMRNAVEQTAMPWALARIAKLEKVIESKKAKALELTERLHHTEESLQKSKKRIIEVREAANHELEQLRTTKDAQLDALQLKHDSLQTQVNRKDLIIAQLTLQAEGRMKDAREHDRPSSAPHRMNRPQSAGAARSQGLPTKQRPQSARVQFPDDRDREGFGVKEGHPEFILANANPSQKGLGYDASLDPHLKHFFLFTKRIKPVKTMIKEVTEAAPKRKPVPGLAASSTRGKLQAARQRSRGEVEQPTAGDGSTSRTPSPIPDIASPPL